MAVKTKKIEAIIFDLNGVIVTDSHWHAITNAALRRGEDREKFHYRVHTKGAKNDIFWKFYTGRISEKEFLNDLDKNIKNIYVLYKIKNQIYNLLITKINTVNIIKTLKETNYKLGLLTNFTKELMEYFISTKEGKYVVDFFDIVVNSADIGIKKPDKRTYEIILNRLDVNPRKSIFIDDREKNFKSAKEVGLNTILYSSSKKLKDDLKNYGIKI